jgi:hypothetical protein
MSRRLHTQTRQLLAEIRAYCARTGIDRTGFGIKAVNDGHFVPRLEEGRQPRLDTIDKVRAFMKQNGAKR